MGALFLVGFACLFTWQIGGFVTRNRPRSYGFRRSAASDCCLSLFVATKRNEM